GGHRRQRHERDGAAKRPVDLHARAGFWRQPAHAGHREPLRHEPGRGRERQALRRPARRLRGRGAASVHGEPVHGSAARAAVFLHLDPVPQHRPHPARGRLGGDPGPGRHRQRAHPGRDQRRQPVRLDADLAAGAAEAPDDRCAFADRRLRPRHAEVRPPMMARINLLPHRSERRKRARQHFFVVAGGTALLGALIVVAMHGFYAAKIDSQIERNRFLKSEIAKLDKEIAEINKLKDEIAALLARKQVIETLQTDRAQTVHLLDELVRQMPEGVYLKSMVQRGLRISVAGYAQSNARVSTLMRNIESSPWLANPGLVEVKAASVDKRRVSEFNLYFDVKRPDAKDDKAPAKPAAKPAATKG